MSINNLTFGFDSMGATWEQWLGTTTDNTSKTLSSMAVSNDSAGDLTITATAVRVSDMARKSWLLFCSFKKVGTGNIKIETKKIAEIGDNGPLSKVEFEAVANGSNIDLVGTGLDDTQINWQYTCRGTETVNP
jgi:hypothetical protein